MVFMFLIGSEAISRAGVGHRKRESVFSSIFTYGNSGLLLYDLFNVSYHEKVKFFQIY